jgi:uncharacterized protein
LAGRFGGFGCNPFRTIARANISGVTSGQSERSISASVIASSRAQSVPDGLDVSLLFILLTPATTQTIPPFWGQGSSLCYNSGMSFTWDESKRRSNIVKHGFDFNDAQFVFAGLTFTFEDDRDDYGEQRFITLGLLQGRFIAVIHTEINGETRIISMRKGAKHEQRIFSENI